MSYALPVEKLSLSSRFLLNRFLSLLIQSASVFLLGCAGFLAPAANAQTAQVVNGTISGTVLSETNRPLAQVAVSVRSDSAGVYSSVLTDLNGQFQFRGVPEGRYVLSIDEPGYQVLKTDEELRQPTLKVRLYLLKSVASAITRGRVSVHELRIPEKAQREFSKGLQALDKKDLPQSLEHFLNATRAFPTYYEAQYHAGVVELKMDRQDDAMASFQKAIDLSEGRYAAAQFGMGYLLYVEGRLPEAETVVRRGLDVDANSANGYAILGMVQLRQNQIDEAEKSAHEALLRNPNFAGAYLVLSDVYARRGDHERQVESYDHFLRLHPGGSLADRVQQQRQEALGGGYPSSPQE